jgi:hypothetical protein
MADLVAKLLQRYFFTMNSFICAIPKKRKRKCCRGLSKQQSFIKLTPLKERLKYLKLPNLSRTQIIWLE